MAIPKYKFILNIGEDTTKTIQWKNARKQPIPLTGYSIECNLYSDQNSQFASLTSSNGKIIVDATNGKFTIVFDRELTEVKLGQYAKHEIWLTDSIGKRKPFLVGSLAFVPIS